MATLYSDREGSGIFSGRNAIINGNFLSWQRGGSFNPVNPGVANTDYICDRWRAGENSDATLRADLESSIKPNNTTYSLKLTVVTGDASLASDQWGTLFQRIEGYNYLQFIGKTATLSFWVRSSVTGIYSTAFRNNGFDRSYVAEYTIDNANTWEYKTITLRFDYTGGTWNTTSGVGLDVMFSLGDGGDSTTTPGQWASGNYIASTNQVNWMATAGNTFYLSNVQLELGSSASPYELVDIGLNLLKVRRYYEAKYYYANSVCSSSAGYNYNMVSYNYKRVAPTVTNGGDLTIWTPVFGWYDATNVLIGAYPDRMYFRFDDTVHTHVYGAALVRGTFYMDAEL